MVSISPRARSIFSITLKTSNFRVKTIDTFKEIVDGSKIGKLATRLGPALLCLSISTALTAGAQSFPTPNDPPESPETRLPLDLIQISETEAFSPYVIMVDKESRQISVYERAGASIRKVISYQTDMGKRGGNKQKRDDHRTPEGIYFLIKKVTQPEIPYNLYGSRAFITDYPNFFDSSDGKTGSGIWLHAIPDSVALTRGSRGCVVVRDDAIKELEKYIKLGETPLLIYDKVEYASKEAHDQKREEISTFIESWRKSWESESLTDYLSNYAPGFTGGGMNLAQWKTHKEKLKGRYKFVKVEFDQPYILLNRDQLVLKTLQTYQSDQHKDYGIKTIYARKVAGHYQILREDWQPSTAKGLKIQSSGQQQSEPDEIQRLVSSETSAGTDSAENNKTNDSEPAPRAHETQK